MTRQTKLPLARLNLDTVDRTARELSRSFTDFGLDLNPPYQRGRVWNEDQKISLIRSWITGTPTGVVILNDRSTPEWKDASGYNPTETDEPIYACIDGQQRISTAWLWFNDQFAVPASWFSSEDVKQTEGTDDGPYVRWSGLTLPRQRKFANDARLAVATASVATIQEEAEIYLLVNGGGTPQSETDMENAARVTRNQ